MKIAVITAYHKEDINVLQRCHESVLNQTLANVTHYFISDGYPNLELDTWDCIHIKIPSHNDYGDTPRAIGSLSAVSLGYDAILFLDADNYFSADHIECMVNHQKTTNADIVTATRYLVDIDGNILGICNESDGINFNDTNCYFITNKAFEVLRYLGFRCQIDSVIGDRYFWALVKQSQFTKSHFNKPTVFYTTTFAFHYLAFGLEPPINTKVIVKFTNEEKRRLISYREYCNLK